MKRKSNIISWIAAGFFAVACLVLPNRAVAGMAVSPMQQWVTVKPGKDASFSVTITNVDRGFGTLPCKVNVDALDFTVSPQGKISFDKDARHSRSAAEWISFEDGEFVLEPGESKEIKGKVSAPYGADGDYWAAIMIGLGNPKKQEKGINVNLRTASGVFVHVERRKYAERASVIDANVALPEFDPVRNSTNSPERWKGKVSNGVDPNENFAEEPNEWQASQQGEQALKINAELKNDGLVAFLTNGKAFLYDENWRRVASIPLYSKRRRILPDDTRCFTGVMSQPLPTGKYKARVVFESEAEHSRKITKDIEFTVSNELARQWAGNFTFDDIQTLKIEPQELKLTLTGGRFTAARFLVANQCLSTVSIRCRLESDSALRSASQSNSALPEGWLELKATEFTLNPNTRRNIVCSVRIPQDAEQGEYSGTIHIEVERSGLTVEGQDNVELHKIPICIVIK